jgi:transcriptional regulator with PAS, ATPase and Fis domain
VTDTIEQSWTYRALRSGAPTGRAPGLLLLSFAGQATLRPIVLEDRPLVLGRGNVAGLPLDDPHLSRSHVEVSFDGTRWCIKDLDSRNGTFVDGVQITGAHRTQTARLLRVGNVLLGLMSDLRGYASDTLRAEDGAIVGPRLRPLWDEIAHAAKNGDTLHLSGETGVGKELAARHFHRQSARADGPFISVNCAAVPANLAERLFFGARRGAYSGAHSDAEGYALAAHNGTLFLDELAEMDRSVQAKLLRMLETREVLPLGATRPRKIELSVCSATNEDLRQRISAGQLREDFFFRIATPVVILPPLRDRIEEIPWLIEAELRRLSAPAMHVSLVEACMLRYWPGNLRELIAAVRIAAQRSTLEGRGTVRAQYLDARAGLELPRATDAPRLPQQPPPDTSAPNYDVVSSALRDQHGNVARAARTLGWHRNQLRRWLDRYHVDPRSFQ